MSLRIYEDTAGRHYWAESGSADTVRKLASGAWVLFDDTPDNPPPAPDGFDSAVATRVTGSSTLTRAAMRALVASDTADTASSIAVAQKAATRSLVAADTANPASAIGAAQRAAFDARYDPIGAAVGMALVLGG